MYWTDSSVSLERVMEMKRFQVNAPPKPPPPLKAQDELRKGVRWELLVEQGDEELNRGLQASTCCPCLRSRGHRSVGLCFCCVVATGPPARLWQPVVRTGNLPAPLTQHETNGSG